MENNRKSASCRTQKPCGSTGSRIRIRNQYVFRNDYCSYMDVCGKELCNCDWEGLYAILADYDNIVEEFASRFSYFFLLLRLWLENKYAFSPDADNISLLLPRKPCEYYIHIRTGCLLRSFNCIYDVSEPVYCDRRLSSSQHPNLTQEEPWIEWETQARWWRRCMVRYSCLLSQWSFVCYLSHSIYSQQLNSNSNKVLE